MIPITLFLVSGIFLSDYFNLLSGTFYFIFVLLLLLTSGGFLAWRMKRNTGFLNNHLFWVFCFFFFTILGIFIRQNHFNSPDKDQKTFQFGKIRIDEVLQPTAFGKRYYATFFSEKRKQKIILYQKNEQKGFRTGNQFEGVFRLDTIALPKNPYLFNYKDYLARKNIFYQIQVPECISPLEDDRNFFYYADYWRTSILESYKPFHFSDDVYGVISTLLLGQKNELNPEIERSYRTAGVAHVLAISGLHVGIVYAVIRAVLGRILRHRKTVVLVTVGLLVLFAVLSGLSGSVVRAVVMFSIVGIGGLASYKTQTVHLLAVSMFCILVVQPLYLFDIGFQLSYTAVFSIVWLYPPLQAIILTQPAIVRPFLSLLGVSFVAQLGALPVSLYYFGQMPWLFLAGNIIAVPTITVVLTLLLIMLPFNFLLPDVSLFLGKIVSLLLHNCNQIIQRLARINGGVWYDIKFDFFECLLAFLLIVTWGSMIRNYRFLKMVILFLLLLGIQLTIVADTLHIRQKHELLVFYDYNDISIAHNKGGQLNIFTTGILKKKPGYLSAYQKENRNREGVFRPLKNILFLPAVITIIDSSGIYTKNYPANIVVLYNNPVLDFEVFLEEVNPKMVIFHPNNPKWRLNYWEGICVERKIPFHNMKEKGFYKLSL